MKIFSPDSRLMRGLSDFVDAIWVNLLMLVTSLPIITIGAALVAGHDASRRTLEGRGRVSPNYWRAFRTNFIQATWLWLIFGSSLAFLVWLWVFVQLLPLLIVKFAFSIVWIISFEWVWALQARFSNTVVHTLSNSFVFGLSNIGRTCMMAAMDVLFVVLLVASWFYMPQGLYILVIFGYGILVMLHTPVLEQVFVRHIHAMCRKTCQ